MAYRRNAEPYSPVTINTSSPSIRQQQPNPPTPRQSQALFSTVPSFPLPMTSTNSTANGSSSSTNITPTNPNITTNTINNITTNAPALSPPLTSTTYRTQQQQQSISTPLLLQPQLSPLLPPLPPHLSPSQLSPSIKSEQVQQQQISPLVPPSSSHQPLLPPLSLPQHYTNNINNNLHSNAPPPSLTHSSASTVHTHTPPSSVTPYNSYRQNSLIPIKQTTSPPLTPCINGYDVTNPNNIANALKKEMYEYRAPWSLYGLDWSKRPGDESFRLAIGSFIEEYSNKIEIITLSELAYDDPYLPRPMASDFVRIAEADHRYPITKVLWEPYKGGSTPDLLATTGEYLKLWEIIDDAGGNNVGNTIGANHHHIGFKQQRLVERQELKNQKADFKAPLTSFDWNEMDPSLAVTSSIDTTCTVWNVETGQAKTQLIAHDKEVYDVAFLTNATDVFASVGADGSVRLFDLRKLEHSTILYEASSPQTTLSSKMYNPPNNNELLRLCFNKIAPTYIATFHMDSSEVRILDIRSPGALVAELAGHKASVNCVNWSPNSSNSLCSGGDDCHVIVWDLGDSSPPKFHQDPYLAYRAPAEISQLSWSTKCPEWIAVVFGDTVQALRV
ncbi:15829_t:CDS:2 [Entrophospora sp. SA101]|nr:15829_t:CDS:2 [Entrophospora sp. SA101]